MLTGKQQAQCPAQQQDQVEPQQAAQRPEHIDRGLPVAKGGECQPGATDHGQHGQYQQRQPRTLQPVLHGSEQAVALGQPQGAILQACGQVAGGGAGASIGFKVVQRARVFFAQAHGFGQPEAL